MRILAFILFCGIIFLNATCERSLDLQIPEPKQKLVVIGNFSQTQDLKIQVSKSGFILDRDANNFLINANVRIFQEEKFIEKLTLVRPKNAIPFYSATRFRPLVGKKYEIRVNATGFDAVEGCSSIPQSVPLNQAALEYLAIHNLEDGNTKRFSFNLKLAFDDPAFQENYYHLKVYQQFEQFTVLRNDTVVVGNQRRELQFSPSLNDNFEIANYNGGVLLSDGGFDGQQRSFDLPLTVDVASDRELPGKILVELRSVSPEYFAFYASVSKQQSSPEFPLAEPVSIANNIENGIGVFAGYSSVVDSIPLITK